MFTEQFDRSGVERHFAFSFKVERSIYTSLRSEPDAGFLKAFQITEIALIALAYTARRKAETPTIRVTPADVRISTSKVAQLRKYSSSTQSH